MPFSPGKLPTEFMKKLLKICNSSVSMNGVVVGPQLGQDFAAIDMGDSYLISKTNPVTFASDEIGYYAVTLNANDVATSGAIPKWFSSTIFLPEKTTDEAFCLQIFQDIAHECQKWGISIIGGHTEVTFGLDRPIIAGNMLGMVNKSSLVTTKGAQPGDVLMITKGIAIEGTAIIAREKEMALQQKGIQQRIIDEGKTFLHNPGISIVQDARLLHKKFPITAMHGPTEGGFAMGVAEMIGNSQCGVTIEFEQLPILPCTQILCNAFDLDPLRTIASGALLFTIDPKYQSEVIAFMAKNHIQTTSIGVVTKNKGEYLVKKGEDEPFPLCFSTQDEITKIF
ncbi:Thiamine-monophosphate kinase [Candidatus Lokiarchaeum ossiferum]|uniref:Thiamine-monophosphate kinase n=1 Tax=Candidatus Lokiarchaeum ossiferum TaxID=2951803 RepID=A0ABY6HNM7_9ARCH|nr:Thiamine-monophosphate kinase [Candidatus Lokiarchaeum sp. B-35]